MLKKIAAACILFGALAGCSPRQADTAVSAPTPVKVARARQFEAPALVAVSGSVVSPDNPSNVAFLVSGKVIQVGPREGDYVRKGQVLAVIDPTDYAFGVEAAAGQTQAARRCSGGIGASEVLEQARIAFERARDGSSGWKQLYESRSLPPNDFEVPRRV